MNQVKAKFLIANWRLIQKLKCPSNVIACMFDMGMGEHDIKMILEFVDEKVNS